MTMPRETIWDIDPHTEAKHEILRRYLEAWFPILSSRNSRVVYVDGFAGPGRYKGDEIGSPIIALNAALTHGTRLSGELVFWFIDERADRINHLKTELAGMSIPPNYTIRAESGRFYEKVDPVLQSIERDGLQIAPTFMFIDPFGFSHIPYSTIQHFFKHPHCEAFITFMVDAINRFLEHPRDSVVRHIVEAFGTDEAIRIAEEEGDRIEKLRTLYQSQLRKVSDYVRFFEMRDRNNRTQYLLFFATNHELGHLKMKEAMWKVDPNGEYRFSDATNPNQLVLFESDTTESLANELRADPLCQYE